jgi:hypothetical protein
VDPIFDATESTHKEHRGRHSSSAKALDHSQPIAFLQHPIDDQQVVGLSRARRSPFGPSAATSAVWPACINGLDDELGWM